MNKSLIRVLTPFFGVFLLVGCNSSNKTNSSGQPEVSDEVFEKALSSKEILSTHNYKITRTNTYVQDGVTSTSEAIFELDSGKLRVTYVKARNNQDIINYDTFYLHDTAPAVTIDHYSPSFHFPDGEGTEGVFFGYYKHTYERQTTTDTVTEFFGICSDLKKSDFNYSNGKYSLKQPFIGHNVDQDVMTINVGEVVFDNQNRLLSCHQEGTASYDDEVIPYSSDFRVSNFGEMHISMPEVANPK